LWIALTGLTKMLLPSLRDAQEDIRIEGQVGAKLVAAGGFDQSREGGIQGL
jgi:hypothetical protein